MFKVVVCDGDMAGLEVPLSKPVIAIGRRSDNDLCLPLDMRVSRRHARLVIRDGEVWLEDVGSSNGTFVGNRRIYQPTPLRPGDRFRVGRTFLELVWVVEPTAESRAAAQVVLVESDSEARDGEPPEDGRAVVYALDAARSRAELASAEEASGRLAVVLELGAALGSILELPQLLSVALERIMDVIPAEQASMLLLEPSTGEIVPRVVRSRAGLVSEGELRISRHMATRALEERLAILTSDATADARFSEAESVRDLSIRSAICAPMVTQRGPVGLIYLDTSSRTHVFTEQDVHLVSAIAGQLAIAIENARLYTDLRNAYDELKAAQEQLVRSERIATVGMLAASIAHDMANIVSPLQAFIELALAGRPLDEKAQDVLRRQMERLIALVQRLLAFVRSDEVELRPTDVAVVVEHTLSLVQTEVLHRGAQLRVNLGEGLPLVMADSAQLERALLNIILNAAEALEGCETKRIEVCTEAEERDVLIGVSDTGPGIPLEVQQRLFEPFYTTKPTGTGLGLYSCRRIVEDEHNGSLEVDSRVGMGTTVTIRLPAIRDGAAAASGT